MRVPSYAVACVSFLRLLKEAGGKDCSLTPQSLCCLRGSLPGLNLYLHLPQARAEGKDRYHAVVDKEQVLERLSPLLQRQDLSKWII